MRKDNAERGGRRFPRLYPILDADLLLRGISAPAARRDLLRRAVAELAGAGVEILQYRNKRDDDAAVVEDARAMREAAGAKMRLILNDRAALVVSARWDGVHVGQEDLPPREARSLVGDGAWVGVSTHNEEQTRAADLAPVDYVAIGPVLATGSKHDTSPVIGLEGVRRARALTRKPLVAIGGITAETAAAVIEAGADSVAVIAAIFGVGRSPSQAAKDILAIFE